MNKFNQNHSFTLSMDSSCISSEAIGQLIGVDFKQSKPKCTIVGQGVQEIKTQRRKHKSKRINKKWLKIYGYDITRIPYEMTFHNCIVNDNGTFEVLADNSGKLFTKVELEDK